MVKSLSTSRSMSNASGRNGLIDVDQIVQLHESTVALWHHTDVENAYDGFLNIVCEQHKFNYLLWHEEDVARSKEVTDGQIAQVKRNIDRYNQQRNDHIEKLDEAIIEVLRAASAQPTANAKINTETPGSVIDRLSIISLRIYHMREQAERRDAEAAHREKAKARLEVLGQQKADLSQALGELLVDLFEGKKLLRVYRQFKMYNDPTMNPYLYGAAKAA